MKRNTSYTKLFTIFFVTVDIKLLLEVITFLHCPIYDITFISTNHNMLIQQL